MCKLLTLTSPNTLRCRVEGQRKERRARDVTFTSQHMQFAIVKLATLAPEYYLSIRNTNQHHHLTQITHVAKTMAEPRARVRQKGQVFSSDDRKSPKPTLTTTTSN